MAASTASIRASFLLAGLGLILLSIIELSAAAAASAQSLTKDMLTGNVTGVNISIDPEEPLPTNGTVTISTERAIDTDMNGIPPEGISVIITNSSVTVTNQTVDIGTADVDADVEEAEEESGPEGEFSDLA